MLARLRARLPSDAALLGLGFGIVLQLVVAGLASAALTGGLSDNATLPPPVYPTE